MALCGSRLAWAHQLWVCYLRQHKLPSSCFQCTSTTFVPGRSTWLVSLWWKRLMDLLKEFYCWLLCTCSRLLGVKVWCYTSVYIVLDVDRLKEPLDPILGFNTWDWIAVALCSAALLLLTPIKLLEIKRQTRNHTVNSMMKLFIPIATIFLSTIIWSYSAGGMLAALNCKALIYFVTGATFLCHHIRLCYSNLFKLPFPMLDNYFIPITVGSAMASALKFWNLPQARIINLLIVLLSLVYLLWDLGHLSYHFVNSLCEFLGRNFFFPNRKSTPILAIKNWIWI